jgi:hypothetical protein
MNDKNTGNIVTIAEKRGAVMDETDAMTLKRARLEDSIEMTNLDESDEEDAAFLGQCRALIERKDEVTQYSVRATFQNDASTQRKQDPARHDATGGKDQIVTEAEKYLNSFRYLVPISENLFFLPL